MVLKDLLSSQRAALYGLAALVVAVGAYAIVKGQKRPATIIIQSSGPPISSNPAPTTETSSEVVVDTAGAVNKPGVVHLRLGSRVEDAVKAAGGSTPNADLEQINLAAKLVDGTQVFVPRKGVATSLPESYKGGSLGEPYAAEESPSHGTSGTTRAKKEPPSHPVSLNSASAEELQAIPGIGPATAQKILDYRKEHGKFGSVEELATVKGIGQKRLDKMKKYLRL